jgi:hypothetical protein
MHGGRQEFFQRGETEKKRFEKIKADFVEEVVKSFCFQDKRIIFLNNFNCLFFIFGNFLLSHFFNFDFFQRFVGAGAWLASPFRYPLVYVSFLERSIAFPYFLLLSYKNENSHPNSSWVFSSREMKKKG